MGFWGDFKAVFGLVLEGFGGVKCGGCIKSV